MLEVDSNGMFKMAHWLIAVIDSSGHLKASSHLEQLAGEHDYAGETLIKDQS